MKILKTISLLVAIGLLSGLPARAAKGPYRFMASALAEGAKNKHKQRVVVSGFFTEAGRSNRSCSIVGARLTSELAARPGIEILERAKPEASPGQRAGRNGILDAAAIKKIGASTGAEAVVTGTVIELGEGKLEVHARLAETGNGRVLKSITTTVRKDWKEEKMGEWGDLDFDEEINEDSLSEMLPEDPDPQPEKEVCGKLSEEEISLVKQCIELKARKTAYDMKTGALDMHKLTRNPGSEIQDAGLKDLFYTRMKDWYGSDRLAQLTAQEEELLKKNSPMMEKYPCR